MKKLQVAVMFGGCSSEYGVSLQSAYSVIENLSDEKFEKILIGITREGEWYRFYGDKECSHKLVKLAGIRTPRSIVIDCEMGETSLYERCPELKYPVFVKPVRAGSSYGVTKVENERQLADAINVAFQYDTQVIIEEAIEGFEVGCAILGNKELVVGEVDEIELSHGFFDYTETYTLKSSKIHMPARIEVNLAAKIKNAAEKIYQTLGCKGLARVDVFLTPEGEIVFNEVNTIHGFTSHSRYPGMMKGIGYTYDRILDEAIELAMNV